MTSNNMMEDLKCICLDSQERAQPCAWAKFDFYAIQHEVSISSQDDELICDFFYFFEFQSLRLSWIVEHAYCPG